MFKDNINQWDTVSSNFQEHIRGVVCKTMVLHERILCEVLDLFVVRICLGEMFGGKFRY